MKRLRIYVALAIMLPFLSGCWYAAAAGLGAYGGYKWKEGGYKVQSPVGKEGHDREEE